MSYIALQAKQVVGRTKHKMPLFGDSPKHSPRSSLVLADGGPVPISPPLMGDGSHPTDCDHSSISSSMVTLQEAIDSASGNNNRSYGSPVMALKESIDNHFNDHAHSVHHPLGAQIIHNSPIHNSLHSPPAPAPQPLESETYLYPVASTSNGVHHHNTDQLDASPQEVSTCIVVTSKVNSFLEKGNVSF